jgi:hypothetical protein
MRQLEDGRTYCKCCDGWGSSPKVNNKCRICQECQFDGECEYIYFYGRNSVQHKERLTKETNRIVKLEII